MGDNGFLPINMCGNSGNSGIFGSFLGDFLGGGNTAGCTGNSPISTTCYTPPRVRPIEPPSPIFGIPEQNPNCGCSNGNFFMNVLQKFADFVSNSGGGQSQQPCSNREVAQPAQPPYTTPVAQPAPNAASTGESTLMTNPNGSANITLSDGYQVAINGNENDFNNGKSNFDPNTDDHTLFVTKFVDQPDGSKKRVTLEEWGGDGQAFVAGADPAQLKGGIGNDWQHQHGPNGDFQITSQDQAIQLGSNGDLIVRHNAPGSNQLQDLKIFDAKGIEYDFQYSMGPDGKSTLTGSKFTDPDKVAQDRAAAMANVPTYAFNPDTQTVWKPVTNIQPDSTQPRHSYGMRGSAESA